MATAYWYMGNADSAIEEFNKELTYEPNKPNTLFNLGLVKWQGKMDINGAVADWQKLLDTNPNYEGKDKVEQMIAEAKKHSDSEAGNQGEAIGGVTISRDRPVIVASGLLRAEGTRGNDRGNLAAWPRS